MNIIVAVYSDWGIGFGGTQPLVLREDRQHFKELTNGGTLIVGRHTLADFPGGKPLPNRKNIVLTRDRGFHADGAVIACSLDSLFEEISDLDPSKVFVIGGGSVYIQLLPYCSRAFVTRVSKSPKSDVFFSNLDTHPDWQQTESGKLLESDGVQYSFNIYDNISPKIFTISEDTDV